MTLYAETSAVLAWLLQQDRGSLIQTTLAASDLVVASDLTLIECDRALLRVAALGLMTAEELADRQARLATAARPWNILPIGPAVIGRAREPFPDDAIRSLDAIHLASALVARSAVGDIDLLSLDDRVRMTGARLGFHLLPD